MNGRRARIRTSGPLGVAMEADVVKGVATAGPPQGPPHGPHKAARTRGVRGRPGGRDRGAVALDERAARGCRYAPSRHTDRPSSRNRSATPRGPQERENPRRSRCRTRDVRRRAPTPQRLTVPTSGVRRGRRLGLDTMVPRPAATTEGTVVWRRPPAPRPVEKVASATRGRVAPGRPRHVERIARRRSAPPT